MLEAPYLVDAVDVLVALLAFGHISHALALARHLGHATMPDLRLALGRAVLLHLPYRTTLGWG
jgi:hypothetical protein